MHGEVVPEARSRAVPLSGDRALWGAAGASAVGSFLGL